jgi:hypothetical protein
MAGVVYIMANQSNENEIRIGHHSTTNIRRETQVRNGFGETWKVVFCKDLGSKVKAIAVEHFVHARLERHSQMRPAANGRKRVQIYNCSLPTARRAVNKGIKLLAKDLRIAVIDNSTACH